MTVKTIVEDYALAALKRAQFRALDDGAVEAWIPECAALVASGDDVHECWLDLVRRLFDWVRVGLERGFILPVIDGIDLNTTSSQILATYHHRDPSAPEREIYKTDEEFFAALEGREASS